MRKIRANTWAQAAGPIVRIPHIVTPQGSCDIWWSCHLWNDPLPLFMLGLIGWIINFLQILWALIRKPTRETEHIEQNVYSIYTPAPGRAPTPGVVFKGFRGGMQSAGLRVLSEPLAWRSARLWQLSPHSTEARRMVPVSAAQSLPSLSPPVCESVCMCLLLPLWGPVWVLDFRRLGLRVQVRTGFRFRLGT